MKFTTVATVFAISSLAAAKGGEKDHGKASTVTKYVTETTHRYGRFDKTSRSKSQRKLVLTDTVNSTRLHVQLPQLSWSKKATFQRKEMLLLLEILKTLLPTLPPLVVTMVSPLVSAWVLLVS